MNAALANNPAPPTELARPNAVPFPLVHLGPVPLHVVTMRQVLDHIAVEARAGRGGWVLTPNLDIVRRLWHDAQLRDLCAPCTLRLVDGTPVVWASRLRGTPLPERVAGSDLTIQLAHRAAVDSLPLFLLGGDQGVAPRAAAELQRRFPGLFICGTECPPLGFENDDAYLRSLVDLLRASRPAIVLVALGFPKQERLIARLRAELPTAWFLGVGISLSFASGDVRRAPPLLRAIGLEWTHRLAQEPRRLARRYLIDGLPFAAKLFAWALRARMRSRFGRG